MMIREKESVSRNIIIVQLCAVLKNDNKINITSSYRLLTMIRIPSINLEIFNTFLLIDSRWRSRALHLE